MKRNHRFFRRSVCALKLCLSSRQTITVGMIFEFFSAGAGYRIGNEIDQKWSGFGPFRKQSRHGETHYRNIVEAWPPKSHPSQTQATQLQSESAPKLDEVEPELTI